jgi:crotonobetainyl-CoA:carnitine CoA-transferase CaiB-like acyl-CoA transferase
VSNKLPLEGEQVLEFGHIIAGPYCTKLLGELGANVIKVEDPGNGDVLRNSSPTGNSQFDYVNTNKKSITLDLTKDACEDVVEKLAASSDIIVENYSPETADSLGVGYNDLSSINDELIYCSIKGFNNGPYENLPALDPVAESLSGLMSMTGREGNPPTRAGTSVADMVASLFGVIGILSAVRERERCGKGQHITSPMFEGIVSLMGGWMVYPQSYEEVPKPLGGGGQSQWAPYDVFKTKDGGWVFIGPSSDNHWKSLCDALDLDHLWEDDRFKKLENRRQHGEEVSELFQEELMKFTKEELYDILSDKNVPFAPVNNMAEVVDDVHLNETNALSEISCGESKGNKAKVPRLPIKSNIFSPQKTGDPPGLGEHNEEVLNELGYADREIEQLYSDNVI